MELHRRGQEKRRRVSGPATPALENVVCSSLAQVRLQAHTFLTPLPLTIFKDLKRMDKKKTKTTHTKVLQGSLTA